MSAPSFERGDVVLVRHVPLDSRGSDDEKPRPALVIGDPIENQNQDYILLFITSRQWTGRTDVWLQETDAEFRQTGLKQSSTIRCHKIFVANASMVRRKIGIAGLAVLNRVEAALRRALGLT